MKPAQLLVNIGLSVNLGSQTEMLPFYVLDVLHRHGFTVLRWAAKQSNTEPTVVALVEDHTGSYGSMGSRLYAISTYLNQDCIACREEGKAEGFLVGPKASEWGPFNPAYFLDFSS